MRVRACNHVCMFACMCVYVFVCVRVCMCMHALVRTCVRVCVFVHVGPTNIIIYVSHFLLKISACLGNINNVLMCSSLLAISL